MLKDIYDNVYMMSEVGRKLDDKVSAIVNEHVQVLKADKNNELSEDDWDDLLNFASDTGERAGFIAGFRYALKLFFNNVMR